MCKKNGDTANMKNGTLINIEENATKPKQNQGKLKVLLK